MKPAILRALQEARAAKRPSLLVTDLETGTQRLLLDGEEQGGELQLTPAVREAAKAALKDDRSGLFEERWFLQVFNPPLRLILVGAVHIAQALAPMAKLAGYEVILVDPRKAWATEERFPGLTRIESWPDEAMEALKPDRRSAVVTLTHDPKLDDPALIAAIRSPAFYIGALGSTRTHAKRLARLAEDGATPEELARIHGPVGLAIGAKSPAEIALSILAEITQGLRGAPPLVKKDAG